MTNPACLFCRIVRGELAARLVFEDEISLGFLDHRPVFPGHSLLITKQHYETLADLPFDLIGAFFKNVQLLAGAVESGLEAHGTFVAMNNRVSQSVPHLHVHIVPRFNDDSPDGKWPARRVASNEELAKIAHKVKQEITLVPSK